MSDLLYTHNKAIVTGAAHGIGRATALMLADRDCDVVILDINAELLADTEAEITKRGRMVLSIVCDMADETSLDAAVAEIAEKFGKVDILVNNAGIFNDNRGAFVTTDPKSWLRRWRINVFGLMYLTQKMLPDMLAQKWGRVINIASVAGTYGIANMVDYSTTKGAVQAFTKALAKETSPDGVYVTSMSPGNVGVGGDDIYGLSYNNRQSSYEKQAEMICFLASENASYCSGQDFQVDGCRKKM